MENNLFILEDLKPVPWDLPVFGAKVDVKLLNKEAQIPTYGTSGAAGFDFRSINDYIIKPKETVIVKTGLAMSIPEGLYLAVVPRSGISAKTKIRVANSPGIVDSDYTGEIGIIVENIGNENYNIHKGDRIAQGLILPYFKANFNLVDNLKETERGTGAFGSTGIK